jgi:hypothetical protein
MSILKIILCNGFVLTIPILVWNGIYTSRLPELFSPDTFDRYTPNFILISEKVFRFTIFLMPLVLRLDISTPIGKTGSGVYLFGVLVYFLAWLLLIYAPASRWSNSILGFCAPAYTPLIWLVGISLMTDSYFFDISYSRGHFILPAMCFLFFHIMHTAEVYNMVSKLTNQ